MIFKPRMANTAELQTEVADLRSKVRAFGLFDERDYLQANPDVRAAVGAGQFKDGLSHFRQMGLAEGRFPGYGGFDWDAYLRANGDLAHFRNEKDPEAAARRHFREAGYREGRTFKDSEV
ncbi:hypothetical protein [Rhizobium sp. NFR03]|uniref:hypothetical protein n=1 Tax=Rhizobium sp. NFR03 TaxID=1566263 RepID=UPI0008AF9142|nr:hypothetical protein [Rhizobium sp. NFR03]SER57289.1 hypothetical protein SAMN03159406_00522 [Rhizobium sp. NFR03]